MKILYYDCFAGISGDMNLGAMIDLGIDKGYLIAELAKLNLSGYQIEVNRDKRKVIEGTRINIILKNQKDKHSHADGSDSSPTHRNLKDIESIIDSSSLNGNIKALSKTMFLKVAEAEAKIHGESINKIHFHEVGAVDAIIDIVGAAICIDHLNVDRVICSPVELGGGFVTCRHGKLPVPAPATMEILRGVPVKTGAVPFETTTPTGAAILVSLVNEFTGKTEFKIEKTGYGIGHRDMEIPNVLRVCLGEKTEDSSDKKNMESETATVIECNIDDMNPELYDHVMEKMFDQGADDVYITPIIMKKSRPGITLGVLCSVNNEKEIIETFFTETTTLGIRKYTVDKLTLNRDFTKIKTKFGEVAIKTAYYNGRIIKAKPEYEDCKRIAKENKVPIREVYKEVSVALNSNDK